MSYNADKNYPAVDRVFAPPLYTGEVLAVIKEHLGENPNTVINALTPEEMGVERWHFRDSINRDGQMVESAEQQFDMAVRNTAETVRLMLSRRSTTSKTCRSKGRGNGWAQKASRKRLIRGPSGKNASR